MIEAMACGTPVIAFNCGSVPEVLENGLTGFVVENVAQAAAALDRLNDLSRDAVRARFGFEERFSASAMAREYVKIYRRLAAEEGSACGRPDAFMVVFERQDMEAKSLSDSPDEISTFYIQATESLQERWPRTLKNGDSFALLDALGDVVEPGLTPGGLFHLDTRHLSELQLLIDGQRPLLLSSAVENDNVVLTADLSNPDIYQGGKIVLPRETLHIRRSKFLWEGTCFERIAIHNFDAHAHKCWLTIGFAADFRDPV